MDSFFLRSEDKNDFEENIENHVLLFYSLRTYICTDVSEWSPEVPALPAGRLPGVHAPGEDSPRRAHAPHPRLRPVRYGLNGSDCNAVAGGPGHALGRVAETLRCDERDGSRHCFIQGAVEDGRTQR